MKFIVFFALMFLSLSCSCTDKYDDESMYDLASKFKDLSQAVDGHLKFSGEQVEDGAQLLSEISERYPQLIVPFKDFTIMAKIQSGNVVLLLCDENIALIEDAGCNGKLDVNHWIDAKADSCEFTIDSALLCQ
tara:strand:- start:11267 stop:11665 length:399 start_codon:yes stop_codon:yes gene_type:complete